MTIVDSAGDCFKRTWVVYEASLIAAQRDARDFAWDVYAPEKHRLQGELLPRNGMRER